MLERFNQERASQQERYVDKIFYSYSAAILLIIALLSFITRKKIESWIKDSINMQVSKILTEDHIKKLVLEKSEPSIQKLSLQFNEFLEKKIVDSENRYNEYIKLRDELGLKLKDESEHFVKSLPEALKAEVSLYIDKLCQVKSEKNYTAQDWRMKALTELSKSNFEKAAEYFQEAFKVEPKTYYLLHAAICYEQDGRIEDAKVLYQKVIAKEPSNIIALINYANLLWVNSSLVENAKNAFEMAEKLDSNNPQTLTSYGGYMYMIEKNNPKAEELFARAAAHPQAEGTNLSIYANFLADTKGDFENGDKLYKQAFAKNPDDSFLLLSYGYYLLLKRDYPNALEYTKKGLAKQINLGGLFNMGHIYLAQGETDLAKEWYVKGLLKTSTIQMVNYYLINDLILMKDKNIISSELHEMIIKWLKTELEKKETSL